MTAKAGIVMTTVSDVRVRAEGPAPNMTDSEGRGTVMIEGGSTAVINGLPDGTVYMVEQPADSMPEGFVQASAEGTTGTIRSGEQSKASFANEYKGGSPSPSGQPEPTPSESPEPTNSTKPTNTPKPNPKTGDTSSPLLWLGMILLGLLGSATLVIRKSGK